MDRSWIIDSRGLAKKVKNAGLPVALQIKDCGARRQCPNCHYLIDNSDVSQEWPGLPAGIKFDPSDVELLEHLAAKQGVGDSEPHVFIEEFIPTLEGDNGICYTHPENLPGAKKDGSSVHFFYRIRNAYACGRRKRRRIQDEDSTIKAHVRWHKTGKTKPVMENGVQKGFKKIMVLYATPKKGSKPDKCNWVMHQYHLGFNEDEIEGEYVVSKIFHQQHKNENYLVAGEADIATIQAIPRTPMTITPDPPRPASSGCDHSDEHFMQSLVQLGKDECGSKLKAEMEYTEAVELSGNPSLLCNEIINSYNTEMKPNNSLTCAELSELDNIELDTPPDFHELADLQFASQESVFDWLDRL